MSVALPSRAVEADALDIRWQDELPLGQGEWLALLREFGDLLPAPLSARMDVEAYAAKRLARAELARATLGGRTVGLLVLYANDTQSRCGHIPLLTVDPGHRGRGIGAALVARAQARCRQRGMQAIDLTVDEVNQPARRLYEAAGFLVTDRSPPKLRMRCPLTGLAAVEHPTPLEAHPRLAAAFGLDIDLRIKRDDLYPAAGGGIKARKIRHIMREALAAGYDAIVTNGAPQSNHARATALLCAELGLRCHLVVVLEPGRRYPDTGNVLLMRMAGASLEFCAKDQLSARMDAAVARLEARGHRTLYLWGGGHCLAGTVAFVDAAAEARRQCADWQPDYLIAASATGSTQAGFAIGYAGTPTRVIGVSVARDVARGAAVVQACVDEHAARCASPGAPVRIDFRDDWTDGGYERASAALMHTVTRAARVGVPVDPTYSGKGLRGLVELARGGEIPPGSRVLFWHTGGLMNLQASALAGEAFSL